MEERSKLEGRHKLDNNGTAFMGQHLRNSWNPQDPPTMGTTCVKNEGHPDTDTMRHAGTAEPKGGSVRMNLPCAVVRQASESSHSLNTTILSGGGGSHGKTLRTEGKIVQTCLLSVLLQQGTEMGSYNYRSCVWSSIIVFLFLFFFSL